ncbi:MAG TPA: hypothetical protein VFO77_02055, partial [Actinoplanes sp.]|nr:hypothetical protein [Actinoplanes sp.]
MTVGVTDHRPGLAGGGSTGPTRDGDSGPTRADGSGLARGGSTGLGSGGTAPGRSGRNARSRVRGGRLLGIRTGQVVSSQFAAALLLLGASHGTIALAASALPAGAVLAVTWLRLRRRWAFEWVGILTRYSWRSHATGKSATPAAFLDLVVPGARVQQADVGGDQAAIVVDSLGLTAVLELGDPTGLLVEPLP